MAPHQDLSARVGLALECTLDGTIVRVLRDDLGLSPTAGVHLADVVDVGSARKAKHFVSLLCQQDCVVGWPMFVPSDEGARAWSFAGAASENSLLILAAPTAAISRENQLYEELSRLNNDLINRERELARKTAALERLSAEKSRIVAIAAHDLRNPLTIITAYADLLKLDGAVEGEHLLYIEEVGRSARYMMELVDEMLDSSLVEAGHRDLALKDVDLVAAARHAATINRLRADRKEITIGMESEIEQAMIRADPVKLRQIINNLVVNAIKFSPSHTHVAIRARRSADQAVIEIADQGIGIPPEHLAVIFEPYKTLGPSGTAGEPSTGLGLAIVKQLAELHGASVHVESEEGRGSLFRVAFPVIP